MGDLWLVTCEWFGVMKREWIKLHEVSYLQEVSLYFYFYFPLWCISFCLMVLWFSVPKMTLILCFLSFWDSYRFGFWKSKKENYLGNICRGLLGSFLFNLWCFSLLSRRFHLLDWINFLPDVLLKWTPFMEDASFPSNTNMDFGIMDDLLLGGCWLESMNCSHHVQEGDFTSSSFLELS